MRTYRFTPRRQLVLDYVVGRLADGSPPSMREIADEFRFSRANAHAHVTALVELGYLQRGPGHRSLRLAPREDASCRPAPVTLMRPVRTGLELEQAKVVHERALRGLTDEERGVVRVAVRGALMRWFRAGKPDCGPAGYIDDALLAEADANAVKRDATARRRDA